MDVLREPPASWSPSVVISSLDKHGSVWTEEFELALDAPIEHNDQLYTPNGPVRADVEANLAGSDIVVKVSVTADMTVPCSRCLEPTPLAIFGELRYLFTLGSSRGGEDDDEDEEDDGDIEVIELDENAREIDLGLCVWETLLLNLPERALCRDDCRGICPYCGTDLNKGTCSCVSEVRDPRFDVLKGLLEERG